MDSINSIIKEYPLKKISVEHGDVLHFLKETDPNFLGFGEAYFSRIHQNAIKAWKLHKRMTLNLVVPFGEVRFVFYFPEKEKHFHEYILGESKYVRLTVSPQIWFGFQGKHPNNLIVNITNIPHDPEEVERCPLENISFDWNEL